MSDISDPDREWDAVVIGAGPAGSATALQLARAGRKVLLLEKRSWPRYKVCGCCLNQRSLTMFEHLGLSTSLRQLGGHRLDSVRIRTRRSSATVTIPNGRAVSRIAMDSLLVDAAVEAGAVFFDRTTATVAELMEKGLRTTITKHPTHGTHVLRTRLVVACDGLGHPSLKELRSLKDRITHRSHIGVGCSLPLNSSAVESGSHDSACPPHQIQLVVGRQGYVGLVRAEGEQIQLAAAVAPSFVAASGGPRSALGALMDEAGVEFGDLLATADVEGTPPLTRTINHPAAERLFLIGDSTGYVEPFTGEGMAWALSSSVAAAPLLERAIDRWSNDLVTSWSRTHARLVRRHQRACRGVAWLLRSSLARRVLVPTLAALPRIASPVIRELNHIPPAVSLRDAASTH